MVLSFSTFHLINNMKHLTTLITTLLLSLITTQMSADTGGTYQLVTDPNDFQEGDVIVIASYDENNCIVVMTEPNARNEFASYKLGETPKATINGINVEMPGFISIPTVNTSSYPIELRVYSFNESNHYLTIKNSSNTSFLNLNSNDLEWNNKDSYNWDSAYNSDNLYSHLNGVKLGTSRAATKVIMYRKQEDYKSFKVYDNNESINSHSNLATIYKKVIPTATVPYTISSYGYSTLYYSDKSLILPEGIKAYTYTLENNTLKVLETFDGSSENESNRIVPKGAAVMVKGAPGEYELVETTADAYNNPRNMLAGTDNAEETTGGSKYYMLSVGKIGLGFYWGADDGAAFTNSEHKAYLRIPAGSSAKALHFSLPDDDMPTAIAISSATKPALTTPSYNLQGINASTTHSGIVISNGKKLIRK